MPRTARTRVLGHYLRAPELMPLGLGFMGGPDLRTLIEVARAAERVGFESLWHAETRITRDAVTAMTALLLGTERVRVGSAAINVYTRGAALTAITFASMAEAAPGRVVLGIGPGSREPLFQQGYDFDFPVSRLREFVAAVRATWCASVPVSLEGRFSQLTRLAPEVQPLLPPPIYLCVTGPRALDCAGEIADGVVLNGLMPIAYSKRAIARLNEAAGIGGFRGEVAQSMVVAVADTVEEAAARVRPILANYFVQFPHLAAEAGLDPEFVTRLRDRTREGGIEATIAELSVALISQHAIVGPPSVCRERLNLYRETGVGLPLLFPEPLSVERTIRDLAGA